ncbi:TetR/AcrR family transcriptional regulator [Burkholderia anthina]|uniref:TetR/AcrR family transcriptional regulator n=1 Tax=Burkholderia anthina TaxID=179879 RepID=UPI00158B9CB2|nr:TetR/AcrR family transcriptional regulator [Burkholderia anthina]
MTENVSLPAGRRGPADHAVRDQIVSAANEHFRHYGYGKTTVSDLAKAIGFSKAYIYKFFDSKRAIGEAICATSLGTIMAAAEQAIAGGVSATDKLRGMFQAMTTACAEFFFTDRKLYDIAAYAIEEGWQTTIRHEEKIRGAIAEIVREGRESGEFERKTPLDETCRAIFLVMQPFVNPVMLQYGIDQVEDASKTVCNLVLRSLAP